MGFGTGVGMGIYRKLVVLTIVARKSCPSLKLVLGQFALDQRTPVDSPGHKTIIPVGNEKTQRNLHKPRIPVETKKTRNAIWSRVHQISARDHFLEPFGE